MMRSAAVSRIRLRQPQLSRLRQPKRSTFPTKGHPHSRATPSVSGRMTCNLSPQQYQCRRTRYRHSIIPSRLTGNRQGGGEYRWFRQRPQVGQGNDISACHELDIRHWQHKGLLEAFQSCACLRSPCVMGTSRPWPRHLPRGSAREKNTTISDSLQRRAIDIIVFSHSQKLPSLAAWAKSHTIPSVYPTRKYCVAVLQLFELQPRVLSRQFQGLNGFSNTPLYIAR